MKKSLIYLIGILAISLSGCALVNAPNEESMDVTNFPNKEVETDVREDEPEEKNTELTVLSEDLNIPWSIEKHGETFYLTERKGFIVTLANGVTERQEVRLKSDLSTEAEAGLLGFVLDPNFGENNQAFAYYTYEGVNGPANKIISMRLNGNQWTEESILLDDIPSGSYHHGGRLKLGPDKKLYATTGDATLQELAQDLNSLAGKILRLNVDGSIPEDNPFPNSYVYSYGHRNPQGLVWLSTEALYASEHGNRSNDEINFIEPGKNYGWPIIEGIQERSDMVPPLFTSGRFTTWAPSGMATHDEKLYVAGLRGNAVFAFDLASNEFTEILTEYGRIRDVYIEDGFLYFITNNRDGRGSSPTETDDRLYRIGLEELE